MSKGVFCSKGTYMFIVLSLFLSTIIIESDGKHFEEFEFLDVINLLSMK